MNKGWVQESTRHSLAAKGIETGRKILKHISTKTLQEPDSKEQNLQPFALEHKNVKEGHGESFQYEVLGQFYPEEEHGAAYQKYYKGRVATIEWMSPDEYIERIEKGIQETHSDYKFKPEERINIETIDKLVNAMKNGDKFAMPWLEYENGKYAGQEGIHRAYAAKQFGAKEIPVVVADRDMAKYCDVGAWRKYKIEHGLEPNYEIKEVNA